MKPKRIHFNTAVLVKSALLAAVSIILTRFFSYMIPLGGLPALRVGFGSLPLLMAGMMFGPLMGGIVGIMSDLVGYMINPMGGAYFPGFTLTSALYGVLGGVLFKTLRIHRLKINFNYINAIMMLVFAMGIIGLMFQTGVVEKVDGHWGFTEATALPVLSMMLIMTLLFIALPFVMGQWFKTPKGIGFDKIAFLVTLSYVICAILLNTLWLTIMLDKGFMLLLPGRLIASVVTIPIYSWLLYSIGKFIPLTEQ